MYIYDIINLRVKVGAPMQSLNIFLVLKTGGQNISDFVLKLINYLVKIINEG
jgi:hypothetical protein